VLDLVSPLAATNRNRLALFLPDEAGSIVTDALKLRQCLINLLGNSCKFTRGGSIEFHVEIRADAAGEQLAFTVADTGIGIAEAEMRSLFVRFAQANERIARDYGGSELGLALSAELAALLGGRILAESVAGEGSRFTLLLPRWNGADAPLRSLANA
jgi:signal transduction histidine kinase